MAKSFFEGKYCPLCGSRLRVVSTDPASTGTFKGEALIASTYQCEGENRHKWEDKGISYKGSLARISLSGPLEADE